MNAVEIEQAISALAEEPFDARDFPFVFLQAFGNKETTIKRLRAGATNKSDLGGVLQTCHIHIACVPGGGYSDIPQSRPLHDLCVMSASCVHIGLSQSGWKAYCLMYCWTHGL